MFKLLTTYLATLLLFHCAFSQTRDPIRTYKFEDNWKLVISKQKAFSLLTDASTTKEVEMINGLCLTGDSTIQFLCDTSTFKFKFLLSESFKNSNISNIATGKVFKNDKNIVIPSDSVTTKNIYASYSRGNGFGGWTIELRKNKTYRFTQHTCMSRDFEEGTWTMKNNLLTLIPKNKEWTMIDWVTSNGKFYIVDNFLIGFKVTKTEDENANTIINETYCYLNKAY